MQVLVLWKWTVAVSRAASGTRPSGPPASTRRRSRRRSPSACTRRPTPSAATHIAFDLPAPRRVRLSIYNLGGKLVRALLDEEKGAGRYETAWDGTDGAGRETARGVYFLNIETEVFRAARKLILLRN